MEEKIKIELTAEQCEVFKWLMQNYDVFKVAIKVRPGKIILNQNSNGDIKPAYEFHDKKILKTLFL